VRLCLDDGELEWHSNQSYMSNPATGALLYALELPSEGGATSWVDLTAADAGLSPQLEHAVEDGGRFSAIRNASPAIRASTGRFRRKRSGRPRRCCIR
jgi:alpha-ketoglutarate-dependent taurine dioxygenase